MVALGVEDGEAAIAQIMIRDESEVAGLSSRIGLAGVAIRISDRSLAEGSLLSGFISLH